MPNCFTYGTLMCQDIMAEVTGCQLLGEPATLTDHRRLSVAGQEYPGLVVAEGYAVEGIVYRDVPLSIWERLDRFEGAMYERIAVSLRLADGKTMPAETYLVRPEFEKRLEPIDWDFDQFLRQGKSRFTAGYLGYEQL